MDVKQEVTEETCKVKVEIYNNEVDDGFLDSCKIEIQEEPKKESIHDTFVYSDSQEFPTKIEVDPDESQLRPAEEIDEKGYLQDEDKMEIGGKLIKDLSYEGNDTSRQTEEKTLNKNMKVVTGRRPNKCEICSKQFSQRHHLKRHLRVHTGEKRYKCDICFKQFSQGSTLKTHLRVHTGEKPYKCEICYKQFTKASNLKEHLRVHTGDKPHKCGICFKRFSRAGNLKAHLEVHTGIKNYKCEICFKQFSQASDLKRHLRVHTGEKPYRCEICFKQFSQNGVNDMKLQNSKNQEVDILNQVFERQKRMSNLIIHNLAESGDRRNAAYDDLANVTSIFKDITQEDECTKFGITSL
uniref:Zinc finger protein 235-like n=1 Tax=Diabrotica virgifera virgifera TaxID=50390 RepID=A0A6P7H2Y7_DIAVI